MHGPLDVISPDELIIGHGKGQHTGVLMNHQDLPYRGDSEATSIALSWDIPSFQEEPLSREERAAIREKNMAAEEAVETGGFTLVEGAKAPPAWLPFVLIGALVVIILGFALFSRKKEQW